ncbi:MAG: DUF2059 domain-containing protein [Erythrobacter sp.]|uniref:DUF2059 domain-containing protein n=1 Tax=Erythrobacter sp. TaxID=1042 RepID=UPI0025EBEA66|nr:DUF2059 domain-containing protein [Erythrobacter sp.]MCL9999178.1 DUF2059 domain-containing protein [Erythrobacter sp.]
MIRHTILGLTASLAALGLAAPPLAALDHGAAEKAAGTENQKDEFLFLTEEEEAQAQLEQELSDAFAMFGEMFKADPLTPEQEALLPLATQMAGFIMPEGSFRTAMDESLEPMMAMIADDAASTPRSRLAALSGVETGALDALSDEDAQEALDIFDPQFAARSARTSAALTGMIGKLLEAVEPAYREGLSRAIARRFDEAEMRELLAFFATPLGAKFASQSFLVQYDPQVMGVMEAMGPAAVKLLPDVTEEFAAIGAEFGDGRKFSELSAAERTRAARLIGKSERELDALVPEAMIEDEGEDPIT